MTEPRFHATTLPEREGRWCVLDRQYPGFIRAEFPLLPDDVVSPQDLAQEVADQMNLWHEGELRRARRIAEVDVWVRKLNDVELAELVRALDAAQPATLPEVARKVLQ